MALVPEEKGPTTMTCLTEDRLSRRSMPLFSTLCNKGVMLGTKPLRTESLATELSYLLSTITLSSLASSSSSSILTPRGSGSRSGSLSIGQSSLGLSGRRWFILVKSRASRSIQPLYRSKSKFGFVSIVDPAQIVSGMIIVTSSSSSRSTSCSPPTTSAR